MYLNTNDLFRMGVIKCALPVQLISVNIIIHLDFNNNHPALEECHNN